MIKVNNVSVEINKAILLKDITCNILPGRFTAIIGKNGSGKTTLINCICNQQKYSGSVQIYDTEVKALSYLALSKKIAYLPQDLPCPAVTVEELVSFGRTPYIGLRNKLTRKDLDAIEAALIQTDILSFSHRMLNTLSGGERQKAFLAMILAQNTDILILDEPNTYMDAAAEAEFFGLLKKLTKLGKTVIVVLHNLSLAVSCADDITILDRGQCVFSGSTEQCLAQQQIEKVFCVKRFDSFVGNKIEVFFK